MFLHYVLCTLRGDLGLVFLDVGDEFFAHGNVVAQAELIVDSLPRHGLLFLEQCQALEALALGLILAQCCQRLEQSAEHALLGGAAANDVGTDAVD